MAHAPGAPHEPPLVSVIVCAVNRAPVLLETVAAYEGQSAEVGLEVIVVERCGLTREAIETTFPRVRVISVPPQTSIPAMRAIGFRASNGRLVGFVEDHGLPSPGWLDRVARANREGHTAIGGTVDNACTDRVVDRAVFYCEYIQFSPPMRRGIVSALPGNNSVYDRELIEALLDRHRLELWEWFWQPYFRERGVQFFCDPAIQMLHKKSFGFFYFLEQRFFYSRSFAAARMAQCGWFTRGVCAAAALILPAILVGRIVSCAIRKRCGWKFWTALPVMMPFLAMWAVGECTGAMLGAGRSLEWVE
jgi:glycosyltransferase involved in cell wall biosynthesis